MSQDIPPPEQPEGEYGAEGYRAHQEDFLETPDEAEPILTQSKPAVAATQSRSVIILIVVVGIIGVLLFVLFGQNKQPTAEELKASQLQNESVPVAAPVETSAPLPTPAPPPEPTPAQPDAVTLPPPPLPGQESGPALPGAPVASTADTEAEERARQSAREMRDRQRRSGMTVSGGGKGGGAAGLLGGGSGGGNISSDPSASKDTNLQYSRNADSEKVAVVTAERLSNLEALIAQGKVVDVILETAINTDLPAPIRAIVSRDVYAESGRGVLIPKGSRVIGKYNTDLFRGQKRVYIIWTRVMRPDGVVIAINSPGVDQIGRGGVEGMVDNKYLEIYSSAILTSLLTVGTAVTGDAAIGGDVSTSNSGLGSTTTGSAGAIALQRSVTDLGDTTQTVVKRFIDIRPTIMLDQGTHINIFVNHDLSFPQNVLNGATVLQ